MDSTDSGACSPDYSNPSFWNQRFRDHPESDDWYATWEELKPILSPILPTETHPTVLMVGCGSSRLSTAMQKDGYELTNIDISDVVIQRMAGSCSQDYLIMDATRMSFRTDSFDVALDKGTYDALASGEDCGQTDRLVSEMGRVSRSAVVIVTYGRPELRSRRILTALETLGEWTETQVQCRLSAKSQLVNIVRCTYPGETMATVLKTKEKLIEVMREMLKFLRGEDGPKRDLRQTHCWVYIYIKKPQCLS